MAQPFVDDHYDAFMLAESARAGEHFSPSVPMRPPNSPPT